MNFEPGYIYHIYNQGNNRREIFFKRDNYLFFLGKIEKHVAPFVEVLAWCLMPNHFHLMVEVKGSSSDSSSQGLTQSQTLTTAATPLTLNQSIGIMLRSYTRAINKQEGFTGSLFRKETKAECVNCPEGLTPSFFIAQGITQINVKSPEYQYPQVCFNYIHQNPVKAGLVSKACDWEFSSARSYETLGDGLLINKMTAANYGLI